ncbi:MAG: DUF6452 family protein [Bacteroidales bacterium]|jgi:hypothetical protein|nr:DUF6452 family protein [Bacteroidales bacterium]
MTRYFSIPLLAVLTVFAASLSSCSVQPCYEDSNPMLNTRLLVSGTGEVAEADSLRVYSYRESDTLRFIDTRVTSFFSVPLDPDSDESLFLITLNGVTDTAVIRYSRRPHLVSPECGYTLVSDITGLKTTHNIIDTLIIENRSVNLNGETNLHLFY